MSDNNVNIITCIQDLMQGKCDWDFMVEKLKVLNRVSACSPIPMDIFHPATRLVKQGKAGGGEGKERGASAEHDIVQCLYIVQSII